MIKFKVKEYYLNGCPTIERESVVKAENAIEAIRKIKYWKYATHFTSRVGNPTFQAHTQDGNGMNGCEAERK